MYNRFSAHQMAKMQRNVWIEIILRPVKLAEACQFIMRRLDKKEVQTYG